MPYPAPRISPFFVTGVVESVKNRTLGSIFIVAGTTIGAGMLAMPLAAAGVGFSVTLGLLIGLWALMCYTRYYYWKYINTFRRILGWARWQNAILDVTDSGLRDSA